MRHRALWLVVAFIVFGRSAAQEKGALGVTKVCIKCGVEKVEEDFPFNRHGDRRLRRNVCRDCYDAARKNHEHDEKPEGRTCRKCGEYKPITAFPKNRQCLYGVEPVCKACKLKHRQERPS